MSTIQVPRTVWATGEGGTKGVMVEVSSDTETRIVLWAVKKVETTLTAGGVVSRKGSRTIAFDVIFCPDNKVHIFSIEIDRFPILAKLEEGDTVTITLDLGGNRVLKVE